MSLLIFFASFCVLAYEILLMRLLSIAWWDHFAAMVISLALLGFGASGALLFLLFERMEKRLDLWLVLLSILTALSFSLSFAFSQKIGLDPLLLIWQKRAWGSMLIAYLLMGVPFLLSGAIVGIILTRAGEAAHRMYALDLLGAGCGTLLIVPALYLGPPWALLPALGMAMLLGAAGVCLRVCGPMRGGALLLTSAALVLFCYKLFPPVPQMHPTKGLPMTLAFPDGRVQAQRVGPQGVLHVVGSAAIREAPGLSLQFTLDDGSRDAFIPPQKQMFLDGESLGTITRFSGELGDLRYLDYTTLSLPYHVRQPQRVLVLGAGGGADVLLALGRGAKRVTALEANRQVAELVGGPFAPFAGNLYSRQEVDLKIHEARQYLHANEGLHDLIQLSLLDAFGVSAGGLASAQANYLYTVEAFRLYLLRLSDSGMVSVTRWLKLPPRDSLRVVATALEALRRTPGVSDPERHLVFIRSWKTVTILVSRSPFTEEEMASVARFCDDRNFDIAYYAGMGEEGANRYDRLEEPFYFQGASAIVGEKGRAFLGSYLFNIAPTTDDRPYFSHFFRWDRALLLFRHLRTEWFPFLELGYVLLIATWIQAVAASGIFIVLPLLLSRRSAARPQRRRERPGKGKGTAVFLYFASVGLAFMFLEMAMIQKLTLLLAHPMYAAALVLSAVLLFAGCGSLSVGSIRARWNGFLWAAAAGILTWVGVMALWGQSLFAEAIPWPLGARLLVACGLIGPPAFFMGWPFPAGLSVTARHEPGLVPWAWGVNGCASVVGAVTGKLLCISLGFLWTMVLGGILYLVSVMIFFALLRSAEQDP